MKKINSFLVTKINNLGEDEVELHALVDNKPESFVITFSRDEDGNYLGFVFRSDLEMLCRANELVFVRSLMMFLSNYRDGKFKVLPFPIYTESKELQTV